jgi:hypothetical protein
VALGRGHALAHMSNVSQAGTTIHSGTGRGRVRKAAERLVSETRIISERVREFERYSLVARPTLMPL